MFFMAGLMTTAAMAVAFGGPVSTHFDVPLDPETGPSSLVVVANGYSLESCSRQRRVSPLKSRGDMMFAHNLALGAVQSRVTGQALLAFRVACPRS
jgi:hypothetical protein